MKASLAAIAILCCAVLWLFALVATGFSAVAVGVGMLAVLSVNSAWPRR